MTLPITFDRTPWKEGQMTVKSHANPYAEPPEPEEDGWWLPAELVRNVAIGIVVAVVVLLGLILMWPRLEESGKLIRAGAVGHPGQVTILRNADDTFDVYRAGDDTRNVFVGTYTEEGLRQMGLSPTGDGNDSIGVQRLRNIGDTLRGK